MVKQRRRFKVENNRITNTPRVPNTVNLQIYQAVQEEDTTPAEVVIELILEEETVLFFHGWAFLKDSNVGLDIRRSFQVLVDDVEVAKHLTRMDESATVNTPKAWSSLVVFGSSTLQAGTYEIKFRYGQIDPGFTTQFIRMHAEIIAF